MRSAPAQPVQEAAARRLAVPGWSGYAWGAIAATAVFIAITCWWLTVDRSIPNYDPGDHLALAFTFRRMLDAGNLLGPFTTIQEPPWPPLVHFLGALATLVGGVNVAAPIVGANLVFVPLLALGCYRTGKLLFGSAAGLLAVLFALASPLLIDEFHVFMLDPPLTAMVAISIWLILDSEHFGRVGVAAGAGVVGGLGMLVKPQLALALAGLVLVVVVRGGWRNWRGLAAFLIAGFVVGAPWYLYHLGDVGTMLELGVTTKSVPGNTPPTFSSANLLWYFWSTLNWLLLAPLFALALAGAVWIAWAFARDRAHNGARLELLLGCAGAWLAVTLTAHHDNRYGMPLLPYLAVIGTGWIVYVRRPARLAAIAVLGVAVAANTLGVSFGEGHATSLALVGSPPTTTQRPDKIEIFTTTGLLAGAPKRDGDVPGLFEALHRDGVTTVGWSVRQTEQPDWSYEGLIPLAEVAHLSYASLPAPEPSEAKSDALLVHKAAASYEPTPCTRLSDGAGVWIVRSPGFAWSPSRRRYEPRPPALFCPWQRPRFNPITHAELERLLSVQ
jgi:hypothetical protein